VALPPEGPIVLRLQSPAVAAVGVVRAPAGFEDGEAKFVILEDRVARPAAGGSERGAPDQAHGAVDDDGIDLVALRHADVEKARILRIHGHSA
jgi:hypothetical protein